MKQLHNRVVSLGANALVLLGAVFFVASSLFGQASTGTILGTVNDASNGVVAGASITVRNVDTNLTRNGVTGQDGGYRFPALPVGNYEVRVMKEGFQTAERKGLTIEVTQEAVIDFTLQVGSTGQTVTVTEEAPLVDTTSSSVGGLVEQQKVEDLPLNGRNYVDLTLMQPGITQSKLISGISSGGLTGTMYSSNGAGLRSNGFLLDGAIMTTVIGLNPSSIIGTTLGVDGIKEYKVVTSLFDAGYGLSMGSQTTIVSKGGTNQFHGDAFEYLRNSSLDARNYFDALDTLNVNGFGANKSFVYPDKRIPPYRRNNFGGSIGGPVKKNKTFFYGVYEGLRQQLGVTTTTTTFPKACFYDASDTLRSVIPAVIDNNPNTNPGATVVSGVKTACTTPTGTPQTNSTINVTAANVPGSPNGMLGLADLFPQPNVTGYTFNYDFPYVQPSAENYGQIRLDQNLTSKDSLFGRYTQDDSNIYTSLAYPAFRDPYTSSLQLATVSEDHIFSPILLNTVRFSFSRNNYVYSSGAVPLITSPNLVAQGIVNPTGDIGGISVTGLTGYGPDGGPGTWDRDIEQFSDDVFFTKGKHAFKFGLLIDHYNNYIATQLTAKGSVSFSSLPNFFNADYSSYTVKNGLNGMYNEQRRYLYNTYGFYAQDDFRALPRLVVNMGLRYEFLTNPVPANGAVYYNLRNPLTDNAGTAGSLFKNYSLHDFSPRIGFAWDVTGKGTLSIRGGAGIFYDLNDLGSIFTFNAVSSPPLSLLFITTNTLAVPVQKLTLPLTLDQTTPLAPRGVDYNLSQTTLGSYNLTIDKQLPWQMSLSLGYVGSRGWHILQAKEGNPTAPVGVGANGLPIYCFANALGECPGATNPAKTNPFWGQVQYQASGGDSYYNSMQVVLNKRVTKGLQFQTSYTWGKLIDDGQALQPNENSEVTETPNDAGRIDRGPAAFDAASNLRFNAIYHAPNIQSSSLYAKALQGWWFSTIVSAQSGYPITPTLSIGRSLQNNINATDRPNLDPSFNKATAVTGNPNQWFNPTMFDLPAAGTLGNAGKGILRGPGLEDVDFSIVKDTKMGFLGEAGSMQFRAEFFNALNHPNFSNPSSSVYTASGGGVAGNPAGQIGSTVAGVALTPLSTAGQIQSTSNNSRQVQFALKVVF